MGEDDDPIAALEARLDAVRRRAQAGIPARLAAIEDLLGRFLEGEAVGDELRRAAHQLRGIAEDPGLRAAAEAVERSAANGAEGVSEAVRDLLRTPLAAVPTVASPTLPVRAPSPTPTPRSPSNPLRILVVDDTEALRKMNRIALERMGGHHVDEAVGVREALELAGRSEYDLVLLDAMMPDGTGMELSAELRRRRPRLRLVILSAAQEEQLAPEGHAADAWWQKPLSPKRLVELVDALGDEV